MTTQETDAVIVAIEDAAILALPAHMPLSQRVDLVNLIRRDVARRLAVDPKRTQENAA